MPALTGPGGYRRESVPGGASRGARRQGQTAARAMRRGTTTDSSVRQVVTRRSYLYPTGAAGPAMCREPCRLSRSPGGRSATYRSTWMKRVAAICTVRSRTVGMPSGRYVPSRNADPRSVRNGSTPHWSISASVARSRPAEPRFRLTRLQASRRMSALQIRFSRAWKRRPGDRLPATQSWRCRWRTLSVGGDPPAELDPDLPVMP